MTKVKDVAKFFIDKSSGVNENDLTNLKLQKILFYAQAESLKTYNRPLFDEEIEAWSFGPVISNIYHWLKGCGAYPITAFDVSTKLSSSLDKTTEDFLNSVWAKYSKYSANFLVGKTHEKGSPWEEVFNSDHSVVIPKELVAGSKLENEW